jgi:hypothetical protein
MANLKIQYSEKMTGEGHPTDPDTLNRLTAVEHEENGVHKVGTGKLLHGQLYFYDESGTDTIIIAGGTFQDIDSLVVGLESGAGYLVGSGANGTFTVGANGAGRYRIKANLGFNSDPHKVVKLQAVKNAALINGSQSLLKVKEPPHTHPNLATVLIGSVDSGTVSDLSIVDGNHHVINEVAQATGFIIDYRWTDSTIHDKLTFFGRYDGSTGHAVEVKMRNFTRAIDAVQNGGNGYECLRTHTSAASNEPGVGADWASYWKDLGTASGEPAWLITTAYDDGFDDMRVETKDLPHSAGADYYREFEVPSPQADYIEAGTNYQLVRFIHTDSGTATHDLFVDELSLIDLVSSEILTVESYVDLVANDVLKLQITSTLDNDIVEFTYLNFLAEKIG